MAQVGGKQFQQRLRKIDSLVRTIESVADPHIRATATELMQSVMELHGAGIERMMEIVHDSGTSGGEIIDAFGGDGLVGSLLLLYGLHPLDIETRVMGALDKVRPYLRSHGGNVELIGIDDGVVRLLLQGSCHGCASSAMTLKLAIEEAVSEAAPDVRALEVEGVVASSPPQRLVQLDKPAVNSAPLSVAQNSGWEEVSGLETMAQGSVRTVDVSGRSVLVCRLEDVFYAYAADSCPACARTMGGVRLENALLVCPSCGQRFEITRAGRGLDQPSLHLDPLPLLVATGRAKIAVPALQTQHESAGV